MHLFEAVGKRLFVGCGRSEGRREEAAEKNRSLPARGADLEFVVLSHAPIDHPGNLPTRCKSGNRGGVNATLSAA
jgi:metallo-beta-lactamase family protein